MKRKVLSVIFAVVVLVVLCHVALIEAAELKDYLFKGIPDYALVNQSKRFERLTVSSKKPESKEVEKTTYEGNLVYSRYDYRGDQKARPSALQIMRFHQSVVKKLGGEFLYEYDGGDRTELHTSFKRNNKQHYMVVKGYSNSAIGYEVWILEEAELNYDVNILDDDSVVQGMPDYEIGNETKKFERFTMNSQKPESKTVEKTDYEGNLAYFRYNYKGSPELRPSALQILRYYKSAVKKLDGEYLYEYDSGDGDRTELHASFKLNNKLHYMAVKGYGNSAIGYEVWILEPAELDFDVELLDDDEEKEDVIDSVKTTNDSAKTLGDTEADDNVNTIGDTVVNSDLSVRKPISVLLPRDALSARPAQSVYTVLGIDDLNGLLRYIFSPSHFGMVVPLLPPEQVQALNLVAHIAPNIPVKTVAIVLGVTSDGMFMQIAAAMPESVYDKLNRVSDGSATNVDIVTLLLGDAAAALAGGFETQVREGAKGKYYTFGQAAFAVKDNLLLIASSPAELEASLEALDKKENRLSLRRRFDSPDFWFMHIDMATTAALAEQAGTPANEAVTALFKSPMEMEVAFSSKPGSVLLSGTFNFSESMANFALFQDMKPVKGGNLFQAGGGKMLFGFASPLALYTAGLKANPAFAEAWGKINNMLLATGITEGDVEDMLNGYYSVVLGSEATVMGMNIPGGYIAITGRKGAAGNILGKLMNFEPFAEPITTMNVEGWDIAGVNPKTTPAPLFFGVKQDTLFVGFVNNEAINKTPELPAEVAKMLNEPLLGVGFIDAVGIWNLLRHETKTNPMLEGILQEPVKSIVAGILEADLSVPLIKIWFPGMEESFIEFSIVDVPDENRLLPRLLNLLPMLRQ